MKRKVILAIIVISILIILFVNNEHLVNLFENNEFSFKKGTKNYPYIMVNQIGYFADRPKYAIVRTNLDLSSYNFSIINKNNVQVYSHKISNDLGSGYGFLHHYELDFDFLTEGEYMIKIGNVYSHTFSIKIEPMVIINESLNFFELNKCGESIYHSSGHSHDGIFYNGPLKGTYINMTGGWHDAGDYIKFTETIAETVILLEESLIYGRNIILQRQKEVIQWGLDYLIKTWVPSIPSIIYMVGNATDHYVGIRLPENDSLNPRPVYICESGTGANLAGLISSALLLGYILDNMSILEIDYYGILDKSLEIYNFGLHNLAVQQADMGNDDIAYYDEDYHDDMALASILFYNITKNSTYYSNAINFEESFVNHSKSYYTISNIFAILHLAENGYFKDHYFYDMNYFLSNGNNDPLHYIYSTYFWGSIPALINAAIDAWAYMNASGNIEYKKILNYVINYVFGVNQWGVCFVTGFGNAYPHHLHHQILYLENISVPGILSEGGIAYQEIINQNIPIQDPSDDPYSIFQSDEAFYQDYFPNYVTNEPTIRSQALLIFFLSIL